MMMLSKICEISVSTSTRGTSIARVSRTAGIAIGHMPTFSSDISPINCVGPSTARAARW
jgi:hypothetical protein